MGKQPVAWWGSLCCELQVVPKWPVPRAQGKRSDTSAGAAGWQQAVCWLEVLLGAERLSVDHAVVPPLGSYGEELWF